MCAYKRISANKTHISAQEPYCAPWGGVMTCMQVCVHVWCITVCLPICSKSVRSENLMSDLKNLWGDDVKRAPYLHKRASFCTLMPSQTWLFSNSCMSIETSDLEFQKPLVCRSLCKCKETHVSVLMLACTLSTARFLSKKHAHVYQDCEHTTCMLKCNVIYMGHLSVCVQQRVRRVQAKVMFLYTWVMSWFTISHVSIYVVYTWIRVSIYMNHVFYTYNREYTECKHTHGSNFYVPESSHTYLEYV